MLQPLEGLLAQELHSPNYDDHSVLVLRLQKKKIVSVYVCNRHFKKVKNTEKVPPFFMLKYNRNIPVAISKNTSPTYKKMSRNAGNVLQQFESDDIFVFI